jgi:hypothetical protein
MSASFIVAIVRLNWIFRRLAILPAIILLGAGCSGINASKSISPLDFFLPGLIQNNSPQEKSPSNISQSQPVKVLAQAN